MNFNIRRKRMDTIPEERKLEGLEKAAERFNYIEFSWREFNKVSTISASAIKTHFDSWKKALAALRKHLQQKGLDLSPRPYAPQRIYADKICLTRWVGFGRKLANVHQEMSGKCQTQKFSSQLLKIALEAGRKHFKNLLNSRWVEKLHRILF